MMTNQSTAARKPHGLRSDLSKEQRERAERIGRLEFKSPRNPFRYRAHETFKFIPSREQH